MSKPKNRVFCFDCGRQKMLFESESKANNFIKFNKNNIKNGDKLRSYYCPVCNGWHVSHQAFHKHKESMTDKIIESYNKLSKRSPQIYEIIDEVYQILVASNLKDRKKINQLLRQPEYSHYSQFVKIEAKVKYYKENNL